jgi:dTDP-L-rhamnose 4-epimerase
MSRILVTGGAGFIGSHLCDLLLSEGHSVRALDNLTPQVHGPTAKRPAYLAQDVELMVGDVRDEAALKRALDGIDAVVHLAAAVGVGQSMYQIADYVAANNGGTATLLQVLTERPVAKLVVASSMSIYGEGRYAAEDGTIVDNAIRDPNDVRRGIWSVRDANGRPLRPLPTPEEKTPSLASIYALTKYDQERMCLLVGEAYGISTVALRFFNVYGPRQALSNPYTGVLAIFASRLLNGNAPVVFEDGEQLRDFVNVRDVARACALALGAPRQNDGVYNIGSGQMISVLGVATSLMQAMDRTHLRPRIAGNCRAGDIRHCFADITRARTCLGYAPEVSFQDGMDELVAWVKGETAIDRVDHANDELLRRGLVA